MKEESQKSFSGWTSITLAVALTVVTWAIYEHSGYPEYSPFAVVLTIIIPILTYQYNQLVKKLHKLEYHNSILKPEVIESYEKAIKDDPSFDHSLSQVTKQIMGELKPAFDILGNPETERNEIFFNRLRPKLEELKEGDRILAICGRKFWDPNSKELVKKYWDLNYDMALKKVLIRRIFVADGSAGSEEYSNELVTAIDTHKKFISRLKDGNGPHPNYDYSGRLSIKKIGASVRDTINKDTWLNPKLGFVLISHGGDKIVASHRLINNNLEGTIINNPLIYTIFEKYFWEVWDSGGDPE